MTTPTIVAHQDIEFEAMEIYPRHLQAAFTDIRREVADAAAAAETDADRAAVTKRTRAMIRAQHAMTYTEFWRDRVGLFHVHSATNPHAAPYVVDATGACSCPAHGVCWHQIADRADRSSRNIARGEAWAVVRLADGAHIWRTTTGYLACFDGAVIAHTTQPYQARAVLADYQQGLLEHGLLDVCAPTHDLRIELVNGMHGAVLSALIDADVAYEVPDRVAAQRAMQRVERMLASVERAA